MNESIGFVGLGNMGQPMARNLLKAGYTLRVYNRDARKAEALVAEGAQQCISPGDVVVPGGIVITMISDDAALENVTLAACRREGKPPFFLPPGPRGWHTKPSCASPGGRNGADNQCSAPYFCSLRQTARSGWYFRAPGARRHSCGHEPHLAWLCA